VRPTDPDRLQRDIGRRIAELRAARELTQEEFAEALGVTPRYLQMVEAGDENLTVRSLVPFADELGVTVAALFEKPKSRQVRQGRPPRAR
jgi:transcriptional regulator with XRE-family HTH domain